MLKKYQIQLIAYYYYRYRNYKKSLLQVTNFIEKPSKKIAAKLICDNTYFWNSGIFIANALMILSSTKKHAPDIAKHCDNAFDKIKINNQT